MTPQELRDQFRRDVHDVASPPMWTDEDVYRFMNWAMDTACMEWGGIADTTSSLTSLKAVANQPFTAISPRILKIKNVWSLTHNRQIELINLENLMREKYTDDYGFMYKAIYDTTRTGTVKMMATGMEPNKVRWVDIPTENETIQLSVLRLPACEISCTGEGTIEFGPEFRQVILDGMAHRAYSQQDADKFNAKARDDYGAAFRDGVAQMRRVRERRESHVRSVQYGGI